MIADRLITRSFVQAVPWHNGCRDTYFLGNSIAGASGRPSGEWTFAIGPDYTSPNYISYERIYIEAEGRMLAPDFAMRRLRGSGVYFGYANIEGIDAYLWDFTPPDMPVVLRHIILRDLNDRQLCVHAEIAPFEADTLISGGALRISKDTSRYCFGNRETLNWAPRSLRICFSGKSACTPDGGDALLSTPLGPDGRCTLIHSFAYDPAEHIGSVDALALLDRTLQYWDDWFDRGRMPRATDRRAADAVESLLLSVKMQQNRDGGFIAGIRKYANSYIRDAHGALRMLLASGHHAEAAALIRNVHSRWEKAGFIPNWWSMGSDSFIGHSFHNDASEVTAYYICMVRDYLRLTGDESLVKEVMPSVRWAVEAQLDWLRSHDYTMDFNGDETEQYCCNCDGEEYGGFVQSGYEWRHAALSFPSMAAALASLEWYAGYTGENISGDIAKLRAKIDEIFKDADGVHRWQAEKAGEGYARHPGRLPNYMLLPLWLGARLENGGEKADAAAVKALVRPDGFIPNCPECMPGFCGHTMGIFLHCMLSLNDADAARAAAETILNSRLLSMYGTVSEFYGPSCTPNGHNCRPFEGGIVGEALLKYFESL